ncbi:MAG: tRNA uridine-5-carboxymethylaminomethyl(34) synthesis enzyme MnmG, partial [Candidatus Aminicenantes bacterium]|nr:tRNA uridine-5-carboxymethylaminomethyl(34) synthesis enzyme MnmG [Candidatus Aminicenantes bacterium]
SRTRAHIEGKSETLFKILQRPGMDFAALEALYGQPLLKNKTLTDVSYIEACVKYQGYIDIQKREVVKTKKLAKTAIPADLDFMMVDGLSSEVRQKMAEARPRTLGEAARIPGVTPAAVNAISIHLTLKYRH